jgi:hypothetical protein
MKSKIQIVLDGRHKLDVLDPRVIKIREKLLQRLVEAAVTSQRDLVHNTVVLSEENFLPIHEAQMPLANQIVQLSSIISEGQVVLSSVVDWETALTVVLNGLRETKLVAGDSPSHEEKFNSASCLGNMIGTGSLRSIVHHGHLDMAFIILNENARVDRVKVGGNSGNFIDLRLLIFLVLSDIMHHEPI